MTAATPSWRALTATLGRHLGVFLLLFGATWLLVRFAAAPPKLLYAVPPLYFVYLGAMLIHGSIRKRRPRTGRRNQ